MIKWLKHKRYLHRKKLIRKWKMNTEFVKQSIAGTWEVDFINLVPEDGEWHQVGASVTAWVKKNEVRKDSEVDQYIDGVKIAQISIKALDEVQPNEEDTK